MDQLGILYYVGSFPKLSESFILNELYELHHRGHNVAVFSMGESGEDVIHEEYDSLDVPVYYAKSYYDGIPHLFSQRSISMAATHGMNGLFTHLSPKRAGQALSLGKQCSEFIDSLDFDVDIIHCHFADSTRVGGMLASRNHEVSCTITAHAVNIFRSPDVGQIKYICDNTDHVVVPSLYNRRYLRQEIGIEKDISVIPATTKTDKFVPIGPTVENRLLTVARLVEKKGITYAISTVQSLVDRGYDVQYHIVGSGHREDSLRRQVQENGLECHVKFLGHVSDERLQREFSEASVFILPCIVADDGDRDAMPVVLKEAMASETACVSTTVSAIPELITDGKDGLLVPPKDIESLTCAVQDLLDSTERRKSLARNGRKTVNTSYDISRSVDALLKVFTELTTS